MRKILIVGSSNTDMVIKAQRIPAPGETILGGKFFVFAGGKGANQAVAAARAGGQVTFVAAVGDDSFGQQSLEGYRADGIDTSLVKVVAGEASGVALIMLDEPGENIISVAPGANNCLTPQDLDKVDFAQFAIAVFQLETPLETVAHGLKLAKAAGCRTILNPAPAAALSTELLSHVDILTPNQTELALLSGLPVSNDDEALTACRKLQELGIEDILVTCGGEGVLYVNKTQSQKVGAVKVTPVDTVGAGDCFTGCLAVGLITRGLAIPEAISFASHAAALSVQKQGAQASYATQAEIEAFMQA